MAALPKSYRRVVLVRRPPGEPAESDFRVEAVPMPEPRHGEALVKVAYLAAACAMPRPTPPMSAWAR